MLLCVYFAEEDPYCGYELFNGGKLTPDMGRVDYAPLSPLPQEYSDPAFPLLPSQVGRLRRSSFEACEWRITVCETCQLFIVFTTKSLASGDNFTIQLRNGEELRE